MPPNSSVIVVQVQDLTESQVREMVDSRLPARVPDEKWAAVATGSAPRYRSEVSRTRKTKPLRRRLPEGQHSSRVERLRRRRGRRQLRRQYRIGMNSPALDPHCELRTWAIRDGV